MNDFEIFWKAYPKKRSKGQAETTWEKLEKQKKLPEITVLVSAIDMAKMSDDWKKEKGQFIPYPSTWLNSKGWLDEHKADGPLKSMNLCFVCRKPAGFKLFSTKYLCEVCRRAYIDMPNFKTHKQIVIPKHQLNESTLESMILKQKARRNTNE